MGTNIVAWIERTTGADEELEDSLERATSSVLAHHWVLGKWGRDSLDEPWERWTSDEPFGVYLEGRGLSAIAHRGLIRVHFMFRWSGFINDAEMCSAVLAMAKAVAAFAGGTRVCLLPDTSGVGLVEAEVESFEAFLGALEAHGYGSGVTRCDELDPQNEQPGRRHCLLAIDAIP
jgi:hypothetical protein